MATIKFKWERNPNVSYPNVWSTFKAKAPQSDELREYVVRDITEEEYKQASELIDTFVVVEPLCHVMGEQ